MKKYTAVVERDDEEGVWEAHLVEERRVHTFGRTLEATRAHIHDAADLWFETEVPLRFRIELGDDADLVERTLAARAASHAATEKANSVTQDAVIMLTKNGYSRRDVATLLEISHQRVQQILHTRH